MAIIKDKEELETFVFYETFYFTLNRIENLEEFKEAIITLIRYWLYWELPESIKSVWTQQLMEYAVPLISAAKKRRRVNKENWEKWGAPKWNKNAVKNWDDIQKQPNNNQKTSEKQPKNNLNVNVNSNVNSNENDNENDNRNSNSNSNNNSNEGWLIWEENIDSNYSEDGIDVVIDRIIKLAKLHIEKCWWVYDSKNEKKFAKELLTNKDIIQWRQEHYKCTLFEFIVNTIKFSYAPYNFANKVDSLFKLFYNYQSIYTTAISNPNESRNIKHTFYINNYFWNKKYDEKKQAIIDFVTKNIPLPR